jgi:hypothetical protein
MYLILSVFEERSCLEDMSCEVLHKTNIQLPALSSNRTVINAGKPTQNGTTQKFATPRSSCPPGNFFPQRQIKSGPYISCNICPLTSIIQTIHLSVKTKLYITVVDYQ